MTLDTVEVTAPRENAERSTGQMSKMLIQVFPKLSLLSRRTVPAASAVLLHRRFLAVVTDERRRSRAMAVRVRREPRRRLLVDGTASGEHRAELAAARATRRQPIACGSRAVLPVTVSRNGRAVSSCTTSASRASTAPHRR
jgi:hypothetical protein